MAASLSGTLRLLISRRVIYAVAQRASSSDQIRDAQSGQESEIPNASTLSDDATNINLDVKDSDEDSDLRVKSESFDVTDETADDDDDNDEDIVSTPGSPVLLTDLPTIAGVGVPSQVIPFTASAPFMQKSQLPEGTVFICVGALLGFLGFCMLAWRGLIAWSLHRSVKKAATASHGLNSSSKSMMLRPPGGASFYGFGPDSSLSLDKTGGGKSRGRLDGFNNRSSSAKADRRSLFFSPTAGAGLNGASRSSTYLPASVTSGGPYSSIVEAENSSSEISNNLGLDSSAYSHTAVPSKLSNIYAHVQGYQRAFGSGNTPPASPNLSPHGRNGHESSNSASIRNKNIPKAYSGLSTSIPLRPNLARTPSAYLEDLFDTYGCSSEDGLVQQRQ